MNSISGAEVFRTERVLSSPGKVSSLAPLNTKNYIPKINSLQEKGTESLAISRRQSIAFTRSLICLAAYCLGGRTASVLSMAQLGCHLGISGYRYLQDSSLQNALPFCLLGLESLLSQTILQPVLPYAHLGLQGLFAYDMGCDLYREVKKNLNQLNSDNYLTVVRNLFVYGVNGLHTAYESYLGYQSVFSNPQDSLESEIETAKKILGKGEDSSQINWTPQEVKRLFRKQSLHLHPDKTKQSTEDAFASLSQAKELLLKHLQNTQFSKKVEESFQKQTSILRFFSDILSVIDQYLKFPVSEAANLSSKITLGPIETQSNPKLFSEDMVMQILGDPFIGLSDAVGATRPLSFLKEIALGLPDHLMHLESKILTFIDSFISDYDSPIDVALKVQDLPIEKSVWIKAGWQIPFSQENHVILCEFSKRKDSLYNIYIYNGGGGAYYHTGSVRSAQSNKAFLSTSTRSVNDPIKVEVVPILAFEGVSPRLIGIDPKGVNTDPAFFDRILSLKAGHYDLKGSPPEDAFYLHFFGHLNEYKVALANDPNDFLFTPVQRSGTCQIYSYFSAALKKVFANSLDYRSFLFYLKQRAFFSFCGFNEKMISLRKEKICRLSSEDLLKDYAKFYDIIPNEERQAHYLHVKKIIESFPKKDVDLTSSSSKVSLLKRNAKNTSFEIRGESIDHPLISVSERSLYVPPISTRRFKIGDIDSFQKYLEFFNRQNNLLSPTQEYDFLSEIDRFVESFPPLNTFHSLWPSATEDQLKNCQKMLFDLLEKYASINSSDFRKFKISSLGVLFPLYIMMYEITKRLFPELEEFQLLKGDLFKKDDFFSLACNTGRWKEIFSYFDPNDPREAIFDFRQFESESRNARGGFSLNSPNRFPGEELQNNLLEKLPILAKEKLEELSKEQLNSLKTPVSLEIVKRALIYLEYRIFLDHPFALLKKASYLIRNRGLTDFSVSNFDKYGREKLDLQVPALTVTRESEFLGDVLRSQENLIESLKLWEKTEGCKENVLGRIGPCTDESAYMFLSSYLDGRRFTENELFINEENVASPRLNALGNEKSLQSSKLLSYYSEKFNLKSLSHKHVQELFLHLFFRGDWEPLKKDWTIPLRKSLQNKDFLQLLCDFIKKGLDEFKSDIKTSLFFYEIIRKIQELDPEICFPSIKSADIQINEWLRQKSLSYTDRIDLHLSRILHTNNQVFDENLLVDAITSWFQVKNDLLVSHFHRYDLDKQKSEAIKKIYAMAPHFANLTSHQIRKIFENLNLSIPYDFSQMTFEKSAFSDFIYTSKDGVWQINLLHGDILFQKAVLEVSVKENPFIKDPNYRNIFGLLTPSIVEKHGEQFYFSHLGKKIRCFQRGSNAPFAFQVYIDGKWCELFENRINGIPQYLLSTHKYFRSSDGKAFLIDPKDFSVQYKIDPSGKIEDFEKNEVYSPEEISLPALESIEDTKKLLVVENKEGKIQVNCPYLNIRSGTALSFIATEDGVIWEQDPDFVLKEPEGPLLGVFQNYILLENKKSGKKKIFIPFRNIEKTKAFEPNAYQNINQVLKADVLEYEIENGKLIPLSTEAALYLIYVYMSIEEYQKAQNLLEKNPHLKKYSPLSATSLKILEKIIGFPSSFADYPSLARAFSLKMALFFLRNKNLYSVELRNFSLDLFEENIDDLAYFYKVDLDHIPEQLRLSYEELLELEELAQIFDLKLGSKIHSPTVNFFTSPAVIDLKFSDIWKDTIELERFDEEKVGTILFESEKSYSLFRNEFRTVYDEFRLAKSKEETAFLKMKHRQFFVKYKSYPLLQIVLCASGKKKYHDSMSLKDKKNWLNEFSYSCLRKKTEFVPPSPLVSPFQSGSGIKQVPSQTLTEAVHRAQKPLRENSILELPVHSISGSKLSSFFDQFFVLEFREKTGYPNPFCTNSISVEEVYKSSFEQEMRDVDKEYEAGKEKRISDPIYLLKKDKSLDTLYKDMKRFVDGLKFQIDEIENQMVSLVQNLPSDPVQNQLSRILRDSKLILLADREKIINAFLTGSSEEYKKLNPHLKEEEILRLDSLILEFLEKSIDLIQAKKILKEKDLEKIGALMFASCQYQDPRYLPFHRLFLVFEYRSKFRMRKEQVHLIEKIRNGGNLSVTQLIMGGGKTSVLANLLLYLAATSKKITFFIAPDSQFSTLRESLGNAQRKYFSKEVVPFQFSRKDFTLEKLVWMEKRIKEAKQGREILLSTKQTIQSLQLEFLSLLEHSLFDRESVQKIDIISTILHSMQTQGYALEDEIDLLMDPLHETNFPITGKELTPIEMIDFTRRVFAMFTRSDLGNKIKVHKNLQASLKKDSIVNVLKEVFSLFFDENSNELLLDPSWKKDLFEFVFFEGNPKIQTHLLKESTNPKKKASIEKISLLKHLFSEVLPLTLSKSTSQHYGRIFRMGNDQKVVPYLGVDTPSFTEFGSEWEAICYHFQTALSNGITKSQVQDFVEELKHAAIHTAEIEKKNILETRENVLFQNITGFSLEEILKEGNLETATERINAYPNLKLRIEFNTISKIVGAYRSYLSSSSQSFFNQFEMTHGFSGTPWNSNTYPEELRKNLTLDIGTEGKVIYEYLSRAKDYPQSIHATPVGEIGSTLNYLLTKLPLDRKKRFCGVIDSAGLFKKTSNDQIAKDVLRFYKDDESIQTVLYFGRPSSHQPMVLMALKKGASQPIVIGSTEQQVIEQHGISPQTTFVYYDETHSEATDILQRPDAINGITVRHNMNRRTLLQGIMRLRSYFAGQDLEYILLDEEKSLFSLRDDLPNHQEILVQLIYNQAIQKSDETFRSYIQKIRNAPRQVIIKALLEAKSVSEKKDLYKKFREFLVTDTPSDLFSEFGQKSELKKALDVLKNLRKKIEERFKVFVSERSQLFQDLKYKLDTVLKGAEVNPYLPQVVKERFHDRLGSQLQVSKQVQSQIQSSIKTQLSQEVKKELSQELQSYLTEGNVRPWKEILWKEEEVNSCLVPVTYASVAQGVIQKVLNLFKEEITPKIYSFKEFLQQYPYRRNYFELFSEDLQISHNFAHTANQLTSIFHPRFQKHADQVLIRKDKGKIKAIMISAKEADFFLNYIEKNKPKDLWLFLPSGNSYVADSPEMNDEDKKNCERLLWQVQLFNGDLELLAKNEQTKKWFEEMDQDLLERFLRLKTSHLDLEKDFLEEKILPLVKENGGQQISDWISAALEKDLLEQKNRFP